MSIHKKIQQVMQRVVGVSKDRTNKHGNFKYAGHEDVNEKLRPLFAELGIVREARMLTCQLLEHGTILAHCEISYVDVEDPTAPLRVPMWAVQPAQTSGKTVTAQQIGQALSYAVKNVEFKLFALTGDGEADSDSSEAYNPNEGPSDGAAAALAKNLLGQFDTATTLEEVERIRATFKADWAASNFDSVPNLIESIVAAKTNAVQRIKGAS